MDQETPFERLREDYKDAFEEWAVQVSHLHTVSESAPKGGLVVHEAEGRVEVAHKTYQDRRDRLAEDMTAGSVGRSHRRDLDT